MAWLYIALDAIFRNGWFQGGADAAGQRIVVTVVTTGMYRDVFGLVASSQQCCSSLKIEKSRHYS